VNLLKYSLTGCSSNQANGDAPDYKLAPNRLHAIARQFPAPFLKSVSLQLPKLQITAQVAPEWVTTGSHPLIIEPKSSVAVVDLL